MTVYSGFATRQQEQAYDTYTQKMFILLQKLIYQLLGQTKLDQKFCNSFEKIYGNMKRMEESKYRKPKLTECLGSLAKICFQQDKSKREIDIIDVAYYGRNQIEKQKITLTPQFKHKKDFTIQINQKSINFKTSRTFTTKRSSVPCKSNSTLQKPKSQQYLKYQLKSDSYIFENTQRERRKSYQLTQIVQRRRIKRSFGDINKISKTLKQ